MNKKRYEIVAQRQQAIQNFADAMYAADLKYLAQHSAEYVPFTLRMKDAWCAYLAASLDLYKLNR